MKKGAFRFPMIKVEGGSSPDPAIYCPANNYIPDPNGPYVPPVIIPEPSSQEILLLCDDKGYGVIEIYATASSGNIKVEIWDADYTTVLLTGNHATVVGFEFPTQGTGTYYIVRISPNTAGQNITSFRVDARTGYANTNYNIYQAKFNTPNITDLTSAFALCKSLVEVIFLTNMNSLTTFTKAFEYASLKFIVFPDNMSMTSLVNTTYMFRNVEQAIKIDLSKITTISANVNASYMFTGAKVLEEIVMPSNMSASQNFSYLCDGATNLRKITMPTNMNACTTISYAFRNCYQLAEITLPELPALTALLYAFQTCSNLKKATFHGAMDLVTTGTSVFQNCAMLEELTLPESMNGVTSFSGWFAGCSKVRTIAIPYSWTGMTALLDNNTLFSSFVLEEITRICTAWPATDLFGFFIASMKLKSLNQPNLRVRSIVIGNSQTLPSQATSVEIDWANSSYDAATGYHITIRGLLDATEINRILTALPTVTGKTADFRFNPGYATCDKTIATAKGWTVL